jgi:hypothetical protein
MRRTPNWSNCESGLRTAIVFVFIQDGKQIPAAVHDSFDLDRTMPDAKENHIVFHSDQSGFHANFWT